MSSACGNGTRCIADLLGKENNKKEIVLTTLSGKLKSNIVGEKMVSTEIGVAKKKWDEIPLSKELNTNNLGIKINDKNNNEFSGGTAVNVGNPHVVFFVDNNENFEIKKICSFFRLFFNFDIKLLFISSNCFYYLFLFFTLD